MAIEIKRTPTLKGNASQAFLQSITGNIKASKNSNAEIRNALEISKKIMIAFKAK